MRLVSFSSVFFVALAVCFAVAIAAGEYRVRKARRLGIYPPKGQVSMYDVERLAKTGHETLAIRAYRELRGGSLREAKRSVAAMTQQHSDSQ
jgi:hypothetical protein